MVGETWAVIKCSRFVFMGARIVRKTKEYPDYLNSRRRRANTGVRMFVTRAGATVLIYTVWTVEYTE